MSNTTLIPPTPTVNVIAWFEIPVSNITQAKVLY